MDDIERLKAYGLHFGDDEQAQPVSDKAVEWGTQQAFEIMSAKVERYEAALRFYANDENYIRNLRKLHVSEVDIDGGERARKTLGEQP